MTSGLKNALLSTKEAAEMLGVGSEQVRRYCKDGKLAYTRVGRVFAVNVAEIEQFMQGPPPRRGRPKKK